MGMLRWMAMAMTLAGCAATDDDDPVAESSGESGDIQPTTDDVEPTTGEVEPTTGDVETHVDLFACGIDLACEQIFAHLGPEPASALECAAKLATSTDAGAVSQIEVPGPYIDETARLIVLRGDGTAILQVRERHCTDCNQDTLPWEPVSEHQVCDVIVADGVADACAACTDGAACDDCYWIPAAGIDNCQPVADFTCETVAELVGQGG